jgi:uncharacterized membrane protein YfcA
MISRSKFLPLNSSSRLCTCLVKHLTLASLGLHVAGVRSLHQSLVLYLLSGQPDPVPVTRANLTLYVVVISAAGLAMLAISGLLTIATLQQAALLALPFAGGVVAGSGLFARFSDQRFRQLTMVLMFVVSLGVLFA